MMAGLGTGPLFIGGGKGIINATGPVNGPSWKMLVELGRQPKAMGIYPGGQSGNPASRYYDNFIESWRTGRYKVLTFKGK
jgi:penicillin amidase